ncbi:hypothetical protein CHARACLAT_023597, partial [Characodon lateralis]|nr:hypothetical protein [Characodon lateralis]
VGDEEQWNIGVWTVSDDWFGICFTITQKQRSLRYDTLKVSPSEIQTRLCCEIILSTGQVSSTSQVQWRRRSIRISR